MAKVTRNVITQNFSGQLGNQIIFRQLGDKTIVVAKPEKGSYQVTEPRKKQQSKFSLAVAFAKEILSDPDRRKQYEDLAGDNRNAWQTAISEYLKNH